jgi:putative membrane protein
VASEPGAGEFEPTLRVHRTSWLFALSSSLRQLIFPLAAVLFFGTRGDGPWFASPIVIAAFAGVVLIRALLHQWVFRYGFGPRGLVLREGLLFRNVRQIEYARIENIDTERGPLHRLFDVAEVRVQTSTGGKPEALISVLDPAAVEEIRQRVFGEEKPAVVSAEPAEETRLLHLTPLELVRHGLVDNRGMILVGTGAGVLHEVGAFRASRNFFDSSLQSFLGVEGGLATQVLLVFFVIVSALLVVRLLSVVFALVTLYDFSLTRRDGDLYVRHGLLTKVALTLRTRRIQAVHQSESPLHRWLGRASLEVDLAGDSGGDGQQQNAAAMKTRWLAPICPTPAAPALIATALPVFDPAATPDWQPLAPGARMRLFNRSAFVFVLLVAGPSWWYLREATALVMPVVVALAWVHSHLYVRHTRWALEPDVLMFRSGWMTRRLTIVPRDRVQSLAVTTSPFDRRRRMASLAVDTAGGSARSASVKIRYLPEEVARRLAAALHEGVSG